MNRRWPAALGVAMALAVSLGACSASTPAPQHHLAPAPRRASASATPSPAAVRLPGGGRTILPGHRVVAYYGNAGSAALGVLGRTSPDAAARAVASIAAAYATPGHPAMGAFELIATVANGGPTANGDYSTPAPDTDIARYLTVARRHHLLLILDVQPGRAAFLPAVQHYRRWLLQPDVSVALDPEWSMRAGQRPGSVIGSTSAGTVNAASAYLSGLVQASHLPQKLFIVHEFRASMVADRPAVAVRPGLAMVFHIDGFGSAAGKRHVYSTLYAHRPYFDGFKLFYRQDKGLMTPAQVLALLPRPDLVTYQ